MTATQFVEKFRLLTEVVSSYEAPGLLDVEIYDLLNISQKEIVLELCTARKFDKLYSLITQGEVILTPELISPLGSSNVAYKGGLPDNFFFLISGQMAVSRTALSTSGFIPSYDMSNTIVKLKEVDIEYANSFMENPFNKNVILLNPLYWIDTSYSNIGPAMMAYSGSNANSAGIKVILDSYTILGIFTTLATQPNAIITYIKYPIDMDLYTTSELPEMLHEIILSKAVEKRNNALVNNANKN